MTQHSTTEQQAVQTADQRQASGEARTWHEVTHRLGLAELFEAFAQGAAQRDVERRAIHAEVAQLKERRYGALRLPTDQGGAGISLPELFHLTRDLATADPNIAHIFRNHLNAVEQHLTEPSSASSQRLLSIASQGKIIGLALHEQTNKPSGQVGRPPGMRLDWSADDQAWRASGVKIYSTGNLYSDFILASASEQDSQQERQFLLPSHTEGILLDDDWSGFGQKLTGSGTTVFDKVIVRESDLFSVPKRGIVRTPEGEQPLFGFTFHQVYLTSIIVGIVNRIHADALVLVRKRSRNFYHGLADLPAQEPEVQSTIGRIAAWRSALEAVTDRAAHKLDLAWKAVGTPDAWPLSLQATLAASEAKVVVDETAANLASTLIDVASGSGVSVQAALDRHWRNIKVLSSHNPRTYKERLLGDFYLNGTALPRGAYF